MASELFFEIGTEELPPAFVPAARRFLVEGLTAKLDELGLGGPDRTVLGYGTPRRLALAALGLPPRQEDVTEELLGPPAAVAFDREGVPTKAAIGFARGKGVDPSRLRVKSTPKGDYVCLTVERRGQPLTELLPPLLLDLLAALPVPRVMRWGDGQHQFVRPVHWIVALFDGVVLPLTFAGVSAGAHSQGHRLMSPRPFPVSGLASWLAGCKRAKVVPHERAEELPRGLRGLPKGRSPGRRDLLEQGLTALARERGLALYGQAEAGVDPLLRAHYYSELIDEVVQLTEHPRPVLGEFDPGFLRLPPEVILSELRDHQRCFALVDQAGKLQPLFVAVADTRLAAEETIRAGNQRVIRARLSDAAFFFDSDAQNPLPELVADLQGIVFHRQLGSLHDKALRLARLATAIGGRLDFCDPAASNAEPAEFLGRTVPEQAGRQARMKWLVGRAALLAKADLVSFMVGEFPELQGIMGREYALLAKEPEEIAAALEDHYRPRFAGDALPRGRVGDLVALADKLDTLVGIIGIGKLPTGNADPFALRRAANGVLRICVEHQLDLDLRPLLELAYTLYGKLPRPAAEVVADVLAFLAERFRHGRIVGEEHPTEVLNAVLNARFDGPLDAFARIQALSEAYRREDFEPVAVTFRRVVNIIGATPPAGEVERALFRSDAEGQLFAATSRHKRQIGERLGQHSPQAYRAVLADLAGLRPDVDRFFEQVLVNVEDEPLRLNRHRLLRDVAALFRDVADFGALSRAHA